MGGTDIDYMGITPDTIFQMVEVGYLAFGQQGLKLFHSHCVVCGVIESEVANLNPEVNIRAHRFIEGIP